MPLVIAVLVILVVFFNAKDSSKNNARQASIREKDRRKTNAVLEQRTLDMYMKHGYSFNDAFTQTYQDMIDAGYDPCIPRDAYSKNVNGTESSFCGRSYGTYGGAFEPQKYDSFWVRQRREKAKREWQQSHPGVHISKAPPEEIERMVYEHFPTTESAYLHDIKRSTMRLKAEPVGTFIIYPGLGTCEIIAHNWIGDGTAGGTYTLKVLKTGQVVTYVRIGDDKIKHQGQ